ncbi:MAG: hypothetical protein HOW73_38000 [Polyangiaceae bacterium]|nr:hypothetical protein [Polyangiaceae bacterium]
MSKPRAAVLCFVAISGLTTLLAACPGSLENPEQFMGCQDVPTTILGPRCATANCHDAEEPVAELDLTPDSGLEARIVDVDGTGCMGKLVDTAAPDQSLIYTKCLATNSCQSQMPVTGEKLTDEELECLLEYLTEL